MAYSPAVEHSFAHADCKLLHSFIHTFAPFTYAATKARASDVPAIDLREGIPPVYIYTVLTLTTGH